MKRPTENYQTQFRIKELCLLFTFSLKIVCVAAILASSCSLVFFMIWFSDAILSCICSAIRFSPSSRSFSSDRYSNFDEGLSVLSSPSSRMFAQILTISSRKTPIFCSIHCLFSNSWWSLLLISSLTLFSRVLYMVLRYSLSPSSFSTLILEYYISSSNACITQREDVWILFKLFLLLFCNSVLLINIIFMFMDFL